MAKLFPDAKIVFLIRNPIDRNGSAYRKKLKEKAYKKYTWLEMKYFFNHDGVAKRTNHIDRIGRYSTHFRKENFLIEFFDAIIDQPDELLFNIIEFPGGGPTIENPQTQIEKIINAPPKRDIPDDVELFLKGKYAPLIENLSRRYGSYATRWSDDLRGIKKEKIESKATVNP